MLVPRRSLLFLPFAFLGACETNDGGYFPATELSDDNGYYRRWFGRQFLTMNEPILHRVV